MALKSVVATLDDVEEQYRGEYEQKGDKYHLKIEGDIPGFVPKTKLDDFRTNNTNLLKQIDEMKVKFKDIDPEKYKELEEQQQALKDKELLDAGKVDEIINQRTERMRNEFSSQIKALTDRAEAAEAEVKNAKGHLSSLLIDTAITDSTNKVGQIRKGAMQDVLNRAKATWVIEDGKPVAKSGEDYLYGKDGKERLTMDEFASGLLENNPYLFESSSGGGGGGNNDKDKRGGKTTIDKDDREGFSDNIEDIATGKVQVNA